MIKHLKAAASVLALVSAFAFSAQAQLTGRVFTDANNNGKFDRGEKGLAGAVVSDGLHVVRTKADGTFSLEGWEKQRFVTLYKGADFDCTSYYLPVSSETKDYLFAVHPKPKKKTVNFVQISDTETFEFRDWVDELKEYAKVHQPDFIVHTGDICYESGMKWHSENLTSKHLGLPVYYCLGNHDLIKGEYGEQYFEKCFGPAWYVFEEANDLFVVTPMMGGDYKPGFTREEIGTWLQNVLKVYDKKQPKYFFNHNLLTTGDEFRFAVNEKDTINLNEYNLKAWLFGHLHKNMTKHHANSTVVSYGTSTVKGGIDHSPSGFRVIDVDEAGNPNSHFRWVYLNREIEINSPLNGKAFPDVNGMIHLSVNTYHTGVEIDSVKYGLWGEEGFTWKSSLEEGKWKKMGQQSDFSWSAAVKDEGQKKYTLVVNAFLHDGGILDAKTEFVTASAAPLEFTAEGWSNLGGNKEHNPVVEFAHKLPYELLWTRNIGTNIYMSSPVIYKDKVMTSGFDDGNRENCYIVCYNAGNGDEAWRVKTRNGVKNQMVIAKGLLIATDTEGVTYAIDPETGSTKWTALPQDTETIGYVSGIVTDGDRVYTGAGKNLCALDVATGKTIWANSAWNGDMGTTPTMTVADDVLIASKHWGAIYAHNKNTGELLWSRSDEGLRFRDGVLSYVDGFLWVAEKELLHKIDLQTGETLERLTTGLQHTGTSAPIILEDKFIVAASDPGIAAFDRTTGEKLWQFDVEEAMIYTPSYFCDREQSIETTPLLIGDKIVFGAMDGKLYVLDESTGRLLWKTSLGAPVITSVAPGKRQIYVCDFAGNLYCFGSENQKNQ